MQLAEVFSQHFARSKSMINQATDHPELFNLGERIHPLTQLIAFWFRELVSAFPNAQSFLGKPGVSFNLGDAHRQLRVFKIEHHFV